MSLMKNGYTMLIKLTMEKSHNNQNVEHLIIVTDKDGNVVDLMEFYN